MPFRINPFFPYVFLFLFWGGHAFLYYAGDATHIPKILFWSWLQIISKSRHRFWVFRSYCLYLVLQDFSIKSFFFFVLIHPWIRRSLSRPMTFNIVSGLTVVPFSVHLAKDASNFSYLPWGRGAQAEGTASSQLGSFTLMSFTSSWETLTQLKTESTQFPSTCTPRAFQWCTWLLASSLTRVHWNHANFPLFPIWLYSDVFFLYLDKEENKEKEMALRGPTSKASKWG